MSTPTFDVHARMCQTCIYRKNSVLDLARLEAAIADPHLPGFFAGFRVCHHTSAPNEACCARFWARHKSSFTLGQLAQAHGTPLWVYDAATMRARVERLRRFDTIRFAQKACSNTHVLRLLRGHPATYIAQTLAAIPDVKTRTTVAEAVKTAGLFFE